MLGVMQGESLSPFLFAIYLNDMESHLQRHDTRGVTIGDLRIMLLLYADDAVVMSETPAGLQLALDNLRDYADTWKLTINTEKTKVMVFRKAGRLPVNLRFLYDNHELSIVNNFTYLGVVFTYTGRFAATQKTISDQARKSMFAMQKYIRNFVIIKPSMCLDIFDKLVKPVLMYCSEVWGFHAAATLNHSSFVKNSSTH